MTQPLQCKQCHGPITANDTRCFYCGTPVEPENVTDMPENQPTAEAEVETQPAADPVQPSLPLEETAASADTDSADGDNAPDAPEQADASAVSEIPETDETKPETAQESLAAQSATPEETAAVSDTVPDAVTEPEAAANADTDTTTENTATPEAFTPPQNSLAAQAMAPVTENDLPQEDQPEQTAAAEPTPEAENAAVEDTPPVTETSAPQEGQPGLTAAAEPTSETESAAVEDTPTVTETSAAREDQPELTAAAEPTPDAESAAVEDTPPVAETSAAQEAQPELVFASVDETMTTAGTNTIFQQDIAVAQTPEHAEEASTLTLDSSLPSFTSQATATVPESSFAFVSASSTIQSTPAAASGDAGVETPAAEEPLTMAEPTILAAPKTKATPDDRIFAPDFEDAPLDYQDLLLDVENDIPDEYSQNAKTYFSTPTETETAVTPEPEYKPMTYNSLFDEEPAATKPDEQQADDVAMASVSAAGMAAQDSLPMNENTSYSSKNSAAPKSSGSKRGSRLKVERPKESDFGNIDFTAAPKRDSMPYFVILPLLSTLFSVVMLLATIVMFYVLNNPIGLIIVFPVWPLGLTFFSILIFISPLRYITGKRSVKFLVSLNLVFNLAMCIFAVLIIFTDLPFDITIWSLGWIAMGFVLPLLAFIFGRPPAIRRY